MYQPDPIQRLAAPPPQVPADDIGRLVREQYGLNGELTPLVSERDQNFRLTISDTCRYVVKIVNAAEERIVTDFQIQALLHIERQKCAVTVPRMIPTQSGSLATTILNGDETHVVRLVSYVPGRPLDGIGVNAGLARNLGRCLADVNFALRGFEHSGESQVLLWDMQRATELRPLLPHVADDGLRDLISHCLNEFEQNVLPVFDSLRHQVIHGDLNPGNVLVAENDDEMIAGVIDFGDMVRAPLIVDVAIAASYLRSDTPDPLAVIAPFIAGYDEVASLDDTEIELLHNLVCTRIVTTITMMYWRMSARAEDDAYRQKVLQDERSAEQFLSLIDAMSREKFIAAIQNARDR